MRNSSHFHYASILLTSLLFMMVVLPVAAGIVGGSGTGSLNGVQTGIRIPGSHALLGSPLIPDESLSYPIGWSSLTNVPTARVPDSEQGALIKIEGEDWLALNDDTLPPDEAVTLKGLVQNTLHAFSYNDATGAWYARNEAGHVMFTFTKEGAGVFSDGANSFGLKLVGIGRNEDITPAGRGVVRPYRRGLEISRPYFTEWYTNGDDGLEQGVTILGRPQGNGHLQVSFALTGNESFRVRDDQAVIITDAIGRDIFEYSGITACSTNGMVLPASFTRKGSILNWVIDDTGAVYPITIDPVVISTSHATSQFINGTEYDSFGWSVALSSDGSQVLIGVPYVSLGEPMIEYPGIACLFQRPAGGWKKTSLSSIANATFIGGANSDGFGYSVALSSDGSIVLIGAHHSNVAYLFEKPPGGWSGTFPAYTANATFLGNDHFGISVALSANGKQTVIGCPTYKFSEGYSHGAVHVFRMPAGGWNGNIPSTKANATFIDAGNSTSFGDSVSTSSTGRQVLVGAPETDVGNNQSSGTAYLFNMPAGGWDGSIPASNADAIIAGENRYDSLGNALSLSSDGTRMLIGARGHVTASGDFTGAAYLFGAPGGIWNGTLLPSKANVTFVGLHRSMCLGCSVSLSSDGSKALIGANRAINGGNFTGSAYLFEMPASGWSGTLYPYNANKSFNGSKDMGNFGFSGVLSSDGSHVLVGEPYDWIDNNLKGPGSAYIFDPPYVTLTAGGIKTGLAGTHASGLSLNPSGALTNVDLYLSTSNVKTERSPVKTGITLSESKTTFVNGLDLTGTPASTYCIIAAENGTSSVVGATGTAVYSVKNPVPAVSSLIPAIVSQGGPGKNVTIKGLKFTPESQVLWNGVPISWPQYFINSTQINISVSSSFLKQLVGTTAHVQVMNPPPGGGKSVNLTFTVGQPVPSISSLEPAEAVAGSTGVVLQVNGTNFVSGAKILWNGIVKTPKAANITPMQITLWVPAADLATGQLITVKVKNPAPGSPISNDVLFQVKNPVPTISSVSPSTVKAGGPAFTLIVNGNKFTRTSKILLDGIPRTTSYISPLKLSTRFTAANIGLPFNGTITVLNPAPGGGSSPPYAFTVTNPQPTISSIRPMTKVHGSPGFFLAVAGTNFTAASIVQWNGVNKPRSSHSSFSLIVLINASDITAAGSYPVRVLNPALTGNLYSAEIPFTVT